MTIQQDTTSPASVLAKYVGNCAHLARSYLGSFPTCSPACQRSTASSRQRVCQSFQPGSTNNIKADSVVLEKSSIAELAVVARKTSTLVKHETTWLGSTKILIRRGDFIAKRGLISIKPFACRSTRQPGT
jgi:hypothetical protein